MQMAPKYQWYLVELKLKGQKGQSKTLIEFAKFEVETVLMAKTCNFDSNIRDFKKLLKAKFFFNGQI
jgi:hypothetical protein